MHPAIRVDSPEGVRPADIEDVDELELRGLDNLHAVGRQEHARAARGLAPRVRFEAMLLAIGAQRPRPRLEGKLGGQAKRVRDDGTGKPQTLVLRHAAEQRPAVRGARRRLGRPTRATPLVRGSAVAGVGSIRDANLDAAVPLAGLLLAGERRSEYREKEDGGGAE